MLSAAGLAYTAHGDCARPAVLFLHGFMGDRRDWAEVVPGLSESFRCVAVDLPGHGETGAGFSCSMADTAVALIELADELGLNTFSLAGYSMGGRLALYMAIHFSMRVDKAVIESASPGIKDPTERAQRLALDHARADELEQGGVEAFVESWYRQPMFSSMRRRPEAFERMLERRRQNDSHGLARSLREMGRGAQPPLWDELKGNHVPLLLLAGGEDEKYCALAREMAALCLAANVSIVEGCGHNVHFERPDAYTQAALEFLR